MSVSKCVLGVTLRVARGLTSNREGVLVSMQIKLFSCAQPALEHPLPPNLGESVVCVCVCVCGGGGGGGGGGCMLCMHVGECVGGCIWVTVPCHMGM